MIHSCIYWILTCIYWILTCKYHILKSSISILTSIYACICMYLHVFWFPPPCSSWHPFSPSCFLQISAHQAPILVSIVSFQSTARRHRSMRLNPLRLPRPARRWRALAAAARAAARAPQPQQRRCRHHLRPGPSWHWCPQVRLLQLRSNRRRRLNFLNRPPLLRKLSRALLHHLNTKSKDFKHRNSTQTSTRCYWINLIVSMQRIWRRNQRRMLFTTITENLKWKTGTETKAACRKYSKYSAHKRCRC